MRPPAGKGHGGVAARFRVVTTSDPAHPRQIHLKIPWSTLFKVMLAIVVAFAFWRVYPLLISLLFALLIALTLQPLFSWLVKWHAPRWMATTICAVLVFSVVGVFVGLLVPAVAMQGSELTQKLPALKEALLAKLPSAESRETASHLLGASSFNDPKPLAQSVLSWGTAALSGLSYFFVVLVVSIYFLVDGERTYRWLVAFLPLKHRGKVAQAAPEVVSVVGHYMVGQLITSVLFGVFTFAVLKLLHVPNATLLALVAAVLDILPLVGIIISTVIAMGFALTVSASTALYIGLLYFAYHMFETYLLVPRVYGQRLRLSSLTVLVACLAAALLMGVVGAILILPIVACYPIVERLWLHPHLEPDTVQKHVQMQREADAEAEGTPAPPSQRAA
jgi:predicted PurR-regulated permease PerM